MFWIEILAFKKWNWNELEKNIKLFGRICHLYRMKTLTKIKRNFMSERNEILYFGTRTNINNNKDKFIIEKCY